MEASWLRVATHGLLLISVMLLKGMDHVSIHLAGCSPRSGQGTIESKSDFLSGWKESALWALVSNLGILQQDAEEGASGDQK